MTSSLAAAPGPTLLISQPDAAAFPGIAAITSFAEALGVIRTAIAGGGWVLCLGHIQPDGDALGSALALAYAIRRAGGRAVVSFDPGPLPFGLPPSLRFPARGASAGRPGDRCCRRYGPAGPSAVITFDTGSVERLGALAPCAVTRPGRTSGPRHRPPRPRHGIRHRPPRRRRRPPPRRWSPLSSTR